MDPDPTTMTIRIRNNSAPHRESWKNERFLHLETFRSIPIFGMDPDPTTMTIRIRNNSVSHSES